MKNTGKLESNFVSAAAMIFLMFLFGTPARANVGAMPDAVNFGAQTVGATSAPVTVTLSNTSGSSVTFSKVSVSPSEFSYSGPKLPLTLEAGQTLAVSVTFTPAAAKSYVGTMVFERSKGIPTFVILSGKGGSAETSKNNSSGTSGTTVAPTITTQPASQTVTAGKTATFNVAATGSSPMTYQWSMNGTAISGATSSSYTTPAVTTSNNNSNFTVMCSNSMGSVASNPAVLTVNVTTPTAVAPTITTQPASQTITSGKTATFSVVATGTSPMTYQWSMNGSPISGATSSSYTTPAETTANNNAQFTVAASNSAGSATSNAAILTVNAATSTAVAPTITTQPASQTIISGNTATFSVAASGTSPMTYQWSMNGTAISGATSASYTTPAETATNNNAQFSVVVSNSAGNATSNAATLTVSASTLTLSSSATSLSFGSVNVSSSSSKTVTLTNSGNSSVTISNVTTSGAGFTVSGVSSGLILTAGQTATLTATFAPSVSGSATGTITVASNATNSPDSITLTGTGVATTTNSVTLSWTASTSSVVGYNTYAGTVSGGPYTLLTSSPIAATSYTDSAVQAGTTYYFVVTSVAAGGVESAYSSQISATIP